MSVIRSRVALAVLAGILGAAPHVHAADPDATAIMRRNFLVGKVSDSRADATMTLITRNGVRRVRATTSISKLLPNGIDQKRMIRFRSPAAIKGTATLLVEHSDGDDDIWIYLPALRKVVGYVGGDYRSVGHQPGAESFYRVLPEEGVSALGYHDRVHHHPGKRVVV